MADSPQYQDRDARREAQARQFEKRSGKPETLSTVGQAMSTDGINREICINTTKARGRQLTQKQSRFIDEYLCDSNATQAAIRAGYSKKTAQEQSSRLLSNVMVSQRLAERRKELQVATGMTAERVNTELAALVFSDVRKLFNDDGSFKSVNALDNATAAAIASIEVVQSFNAEGEITTRTMKIRFWDKNSAIDKAMKHLGLFEVDNHPTADPIAELLNEIAQRGNTLLVRE